MAGPWEEYQSKPWEDYRGTTPRTPVEKPLPTAAPPQPGDAPFAESVFGQLDQPTGNLALDTLREYPYQLESAARFGSQMFGHGTRAIGTGKPSGLVGQVVGATGVLGAPVSALFGPISRPVHDLVGNPAERATGIPGTADVVTAGALAAPGMLRGANLPRTEVAGRTGIPQRGPRGPVPTNEQLLQQKNAAYKVVDDSGIVVKPEAIDPLLQTVTDDLAGMSYRQGHQPQIKLLLDEIKQAASGLDSEGNPVHGHTITSLDGIRKAALNVARSSDNDTEATMASHIAQHISDRINSLNPRHDTVGGEDPAKIIASLREARSANSRLSKSELIDLAVQLAQNRSGSNNNARLQENIRQNLRSMILDKIDKGWRMGFTPAETEQLRTAVHGGRWENTLQWIGRFSPDTNVAKSLVPGGIGFALGGPIGVAAGEGAVMGAKLGAGQLADMNRMRLSRMVRAGETKPGSIRQQRFRNQSLPGNRDEGWQPPPNGSDPMPPNFEPPAPGGSGGGGGQQPPRGPSGGGSPPIRSLEDAQRFNRALTPPGAPPAPAPAPAPAPQPFSITLAANDRLPAITAKPSGPISLQDPAPTAWSKPSIDGSRQVEYPITQGDYQIGYITGQIKGDQFYIDHVMTHGGPNSLTPQVVRQIGRALRAKLPPEIKTIAGKRISGARHGPAKAMNNKSTMARAPISALSIPLAAASASALLQGFGAPQDQR